MKQLPLLKLKWASAKFEVQCIATLCIPASSSLCTWVDQDLKTVFQALKEETYYK